jgi:hypothetical protein
MLNSMRMFIATFPVRQMMASTPLVYQQENLFMSNTTNQNQLKKKKKIGSPGARHLAAGAEKVGSSGASYFAAGAQKVGSPGASYFAAGAQKARGVHK